MRPLPGIGAIVGVVLAAAGLWVAGPGSEPADAILDGYRLYVPGVASDSAAAPTPTPTPTPIGGGGGGAGALEIYVSLDIVRAGTEH
jgi:hypothetical protein